MVVKNNKNKNELLVAAALLLQCFFCEGSTPWKTTRLKYKKKKANQKAPCYGALCKKPHS
jgi:hypothetical protein